MTIFAENLNFEQNPYFYEKPLILVKTMYFCVFLYF
nr:MAG TPA: hypothetical protein [Caudoviricetes sp.]